MEKSASNGSLRTGESSGVSDQGSVVDQELERSMGKPPMYFKITWSFLSPLIVVFLIVAKAAAHERASLLSGAYVYPAWADNLGWMMVAFVVVWVPVIMIA